MNPSQPETPATLLERRVLIGLAIACAACGVYKFATGGSDDKVPLFYFLAAGALVLLKSMKSFAFGDFKAEFEQRLEQRLTEVKEQIQRDSPMNHMSKRAETRPEGLAAEPARSAFDREGTPASVTAGSDDPHKGKFGGRPRDNGRVLKASLKPVAGSSEYVDIRLVVCSENPAVHPLAGTVTFYLHPSFPATPRVVSVVNGEAVLNLRAYGAFTVGAEADGGTTRLESDLMDVPGGTKEFYRN